MNNLNKVQKSPTPISQSEQRQPTKKFNDGFIRFMKAADPKNDPVLMILKCHLLAEFYMDKLLIAALPRGDILVDEDKVQLMFFNKLSVVEALNILSKKIIDSLKKLNKLRNDCSHEQDYEISECDIDKLGNPFGVDYLKQKKEISDKKQLLFRTLMILISWLDFETDKYILKKLT